MKSKISGNMLNEDECPLPGFFETVRATSPPIISSPEEEIEKMRSHTSGLRQKLKTALEREILYQTRIENFENKLCKKRIHLENLEVKIIKLKLQNEKLRLENKQLKNIQ